MSRRNRINDGSEGPDTIAERTSEAAVRNKQIEEAANFVQVPVKAIRNADAGRGWGFVLGTVFPSIFTKSVPPADPYEPTSSIVHVMLNMDANVMEQFPVGASVPNSSGMFLWLPMQSYNALWHMGFVPGGYTESADGGGENGFAAAGENTYINSATLGIAALTYDQELAVPYGNTAQNYTIKFSPSLEKDYRSVRAFNGGIQFNSTTVSLGANTLGGRLNAAIIPDTIDIAQKAGEAYAISELITSSILSKEKAVAIGAQDGIRMNIGDNLHHGFQEPNIFAVNNEMGPQALIYSETHSLADPQAYLALMTGINGSNGLLAVHGLLDCYWISPRATTAPLDSMYTAVKFAPQNATLTGAGDAGWNPTKKNLTVTSGNVSQIGESDWLDIELRYYMKENASSDFWILNGERLTCVMKHCFVSIDNARNGSLDYRWYPESFTVPYPKTEGSTFADNYHVVSFKSQGNLQMGLASMSEAVKGAKTPNNAGVNAGAIGNVGKYLGTVVTVHYHSNSGISGTEAFNYTTATGFPFASHIIIGQKEVYAQAHDGHGRGTRGPAHIIRYDDLSAGQNVSLGGEINLQAVTQAELSQLTKAGNSMLRSPIKQDFLSLVHTLYTTESVRDIKTVYPLREYERLKNWLPDISYQDFSRRLMVECESNHPCAVAAETSGLMEGLGSTTGALAVPISGSGTFSGLNIGGRAGGIGGIQGLNYGSAAAFGM